MQKRVLNFINLNKTSGSKNIFRIMYRGGKKKEKMIFLHLVLGWIGGIGRKSLNKGMYVLGEETKGRNLMI